MTEPTDLQALARRYLDLWQENLGAMARDPAVSDALARSFSLMTQGLADAARAAPDAPSAPDREPDGGRHGRSEPAPDPASAPAAGPSGAATAGRASGDAGPADDELADRVAGLERRVALLEAALGGLLAGAGGGPKPG